MYRLIHYDAERVAVGAAVPGAVDPEPITGAAVGRGGAARLGVAAHGAQDVVDAGHGRTGRLPAPHRLRRLPAAHHARSPHALGHPSRFWSVPWKYFSQSNRSSVIWIWRVHELQSCGVQAIWSEFFDNAEEFV